MIPSEEGVEVMPGLPTSLSSDSDSDSDSDSFPSDVEDEEWTGDFEEDPADLKDDPPPPDQSNSLSSQSSSESISIKNQQRGGA
jgi:hypothetical protein